MRFNLNNFPKRENYPNVPAGVTEPYTVAVEKWFEGFEKELRERLQELNKDDSRLYDVAKDHEALIIEEILRKC